jgi:hypothetical protein
MVTHAAVAVRPAVPRALWALPLGLVLLGIVLAAILSGSALAHPDWSSWTTLTPAARSALGRLRSPTEFRWELVSLLLLTMYVYTVEVQAGRLGVVLAGLALFGMDWFNELWNGLVLHFTRTSAVWVTPGQSSLVLLPGWSIEIAFMFLVMGVVGVKMLPADRGARVLGLPNRWFFAVVLSALAVIVEVLLNLAGVLVWHWWFWRLPNVALVFLVGYLPFFVVSFLVYDLEGLARKVLVVSSLLSFDLLLTLVFAVGLGWM